jgi:hypothetical protein
LTFGREWRKQEQKEGSDEISVSKAPKAVKKVLFIW